jgi:hypothetical protein
MTPIEARLETRTTFLTIQPILGPLFILGKTSPVATEETRTIPDRTVINDQLSWMQVGHASGGGSTVRVNCSVWVIDPFVAVMVPA